jgi:cell division protease FtsH
MFLPEEDRYSISRRKLTSQICALFGGRIAEELTLGADGITTGASNDIERATKMAKNMVTKWGLSDKLGPLTYAEDDDEVFLGMSAGGSKIQVSGETAKMIDEEVRLIIDGCYSTATTILTENRDKLDAMAEALLEYETIDREQIDQIMAGGKPRPPSGWDDAGPGDLDTPDPGEVDPSPSGGPVGGPAGEH